jgi:hypothetical protein
MADQLHCPQCRVALVPDRLREATFVKCFGCQSELRAIAYPALAHRPHAAPSETTTGDGDASCFFHATRRAQSTCDQCGRFICGLCEVEVRDRKLCPTCLTTGRATGELSQLETSRARWDSRCLLLASAPLLFWPLTLVTAPAVLVLAARFWKAPGSLVTPRRWRFVVAILLAVLELGGWGLLGIGLATGAFD